MARLIRRSMLLLFVLFCCAQVFTSALGMQSSSVRPGQFDCATKDGTVIIGVALGLVEM